MEDYILYNIYCDESFHLPNDDSDIMVLGAIKCPENKKREIFEDIRQIKIKHDISTWAEIKWTKVSNSKIELYKELIDYFFENNNLEFRSIVAKGKDRLDHKKYNGGNYDLWYYKMYFYLLNKLVDLDEHYNIFIDIKDTNGGPRIHKLRDVLSNNIYDMSKEKIKGIYQVNSRESEILQLTDLIIGCISYRNRGLYKKDSNKGKDKLVDHLMDASCRNLLSSTSKYEYKFNLFIWNPRE